MRTFFFATVSILLIASPAWAEQCVTIDTSAWTPKQIRWRSHLAGSLVQAKANDVWTRPDIQGDTICFDPDPVFADPADTVQSVVTEQVMLDLFAQEKAIKAANNAAAQQRFQAMQAELSNTLCDADLDELDQRIDAGVDQIDNLAKAKTFLRRALKKIARCLRAAREVER